MKKLLPLVLALFISACGASTPEPAWKENAYRALHEYKINFLAGKEASTEPHFVKARREIAAGNDLSLLTIAYLTKYALHTASLEDFDTSDFAKLYRLQPNPADMAYCHFLKGNFSAVDAALLPSRYRGLLRAASTRDSVTAVREIAAIDDSLSRLIACGVWVKYMPSDEVILQTGISIASTNGWKRPLWAYLNKLQTHYLEKGDRKNAAAVKERLEILKKD